MTGLGSLAVITTLLFVCNGETIASVDTTAEDLYAGVDLDALGASRASSDVVDDFDKRIISGQKSSKGQWPWLIGIHKRNIPGVICGGSLIDKTTVVTAAHCFTHSQNPFDYTVLVGETNLRSIRGGNKFKLSKITPHPEYRFYMATNSPSDIAIVKLARPVPFDSKVSAIALPKRQQAAPVETTCYAGGWGRTEARDWALEMFHVGIKIRPIQMCQQMYRGNKFYYPQRQVCAGGHTFKNVCVGDSGGPLACRNRDGSYYLEGIVSFGAHFCGRDRRKYPTVFTRVESFLDWIQRNRR